MIQVTNGSSNKKRIAILISCVAFIIILAITIIFIYNYSLRVKYDSEYETSIIYHNLIDEIQYFQNQNISLLSGFSAYIQMKDMYTDTEIYTYLDYLLKDHLDDIRNIGIFQDTTIMWAYPLEGNEDAIGVDLSKVPEQAEAILRVKENLETLFVGPINLIQGGTGFIIRMPLTKNDTYWGMVSIVLRAENAFGFIENHSDRYNVEYLITHGDKLDEVIFGDRDVLNMQPLKFRIEDSLGGWDIYAVPNGGWNDQRGTLGIIFVIGFFINIMISRYIYSWIINYNKVLDDKIELEKKYILDRFTGIYTRDYFNLKVHEEFKNVERHGYPISMIYFDLDHFKNVNDTYGHATGDKVLLQVVDIVKSIIRESDIFARWGGDEFILLLPHADLRQAIEVSERIRYEIENLEINKSLGVTASLGCSQWKIMEYIESWFSRTDKALYASKNSGKNKVTSNDHNSEKNILVKVRWDKS